jgi:cyclophilin family peptidyl-prolyl cis-trans isomerase
MLGISYNVTAKQRAAVVGLAAVIACAAISSVAHATIVRFYTIEGNVDVRLYDTATPLYVANFLHYVNTNSYTGTFIHRSISGFIVQGGAYTYTQAGLALVPQFAPVNNEPGISNLAGTVSMAKVGPENGGGPNTATNQWFFNLSDSNPGSPPNGLDYQNGGFTVFGRVLGDGMDIISTFASTSYPNTPVTLSGTALTVPVKNGNQLAYIYGVQALTLPAGDYDGNGTVNALDYAVWRDTLGSTTFAEADGNGNGKVDAADYVIWRKTFGQTSGAGAGSGAGFESFGVPEPTSGVLILLAGAMLTFCRARFSTRRVNQTR